jgi:AbrB family looped-hinge helix DNA binding protein
MNILATTKMSSKGQVVIPEAIRDQLNLEAGVQFAVVAEKDVVILKIITQPKISDFMKMIKQVRKEAKAAGLTQEDIEEAIKEVRKK